MSKVYKIYLCGLGSTNDLKYPSFQPDPWCVEIAERYSRPIYDFEYKKYLPTHIYNVPMVIRNSDFIIVRNINAHIEKELMYAYSLDIEEYKTKIKRPKILIIDYEINWTNRKIYDHISPSMKNGFKWIENQIEEMENESLPLG